MSSSKLFSDSQFLTLIADKRNIRDYRVVLAFFIISLAVTLAMFAYSRNNNRQSVQRLFAQASRVVEDDLAQTLHTYGLFLSSGAALFHSSQEVTRDEWRDYVETVDLERNYPGIQGVSYNPILRSDTALQAFLQTVRDTDMPDFGLRPPGPRDLYVPILYLEPFNTRNAPAMGFDIYSEANRRDAIERAMASGEPQMTAKITLVQAREDGSDGTQTPGFLVVLPVFEGTNDGSDSDANRGRATGVIVSVFEADDLVASILAQSGEAQAAQLTLRIYDGPQASPENALFLGDTADGSRGHEPAFMTSTQLQVFGREWTFQTASTPTFERNSRRNSHHIVLWAGLLIALLFTRLAWAQTAWNRASKRANQRLEDSNTRVTTLMREVNHRSKNLLSVIMVIVRQTTGTRDPAFADSFSKRLEALAGSQDLLVKNQWEDVALAELITSQLAHFKPLVGSRILLDGPAVRLSANTAQTIGMAVHELATNAAKYGALSNEHGVVTIEWSVRDDCPESEAFELSWVESGGPSVKPPKQMGFGSKVTGKIAEMSLSAKVASEYQPDGFRWRLTCAVANLVK